MDLSRSMNTLKIFWKQNNRTILTYGSVVLTVSAVIEAIKATSLAKDIIDDAEYDKFEAMGCPEDNDIDYRLTKSEIFKTTWKCYIWTSLLLSGAVACGIASHMESNKRIKAASIAYGSLLETYNTYRDNVEKVVKEKDIRAINHGMAHDIVEKDKHYMSESVKDKLFNDDGESIKNLYRDAYSANIPGGYFKRTNDEILRAELDFNSKLARDGYATLNDWYDCLDIGHSETGDYYGWRYNENGPLFATTATDDFIVTKDTYNVICLGLGYSRYGKFMEYPKAI